MSKTIDAFRLEIKRSIHLSLLAVMFVIALIILLTLYVAKSAGGIENAGQFGDVFGFANALFSGMALIGVVFAITNQNREFNQQILELRSQTALWHTQNIHHVLETALREYRSVEMFSAVKYLWDFARKNESNLVLAYDMLKKEEEERIGSLPKSERMVAEALSLHFQRQLVSRFYQYLGGLVQEGIIEETVIYRYWNRGALQIIPQILVPIENHLDRAYNLGQDCKTGLLMNLYNKSPSVEIRHGN